VGGFGVVVNPHAGRNRHERDRAEELRRLVADRGRVCETQDLDEIEEAACGFRAAGIEVLAICGGDGSFFRTLSAMVRAYDGAPLPHFLPLRAGSMNTIARGVGCRSGTPEAVLAAVLDDHAAGRPFDLADYDLLCVNRRHHGFMTGAGVIVNFLQAYYERPKRGPLAAATLLGRVCVGGLLGSDDIRRLFDTTPGSIECDGRALGTSPLRVIFGSTVAEIGLGFRLAYKANSSPGAFHFLAGAPAPLEVLFKLPAVRRGRGLDLPGWHDVLARRVVLELERPTAYMIDGDILEKVDRLEWSTGPRLSIIRK
jgi:diacylglycerol kinase family enzyme